MIATMLRRLRLIVPLVLMTVILSAAVAVPSASAHSSKRIHFAFSGRAWVLGDFSIVFPNIECDTGNLFFSGVLDTGHCLNVHAGLTRAVFGEASVVTDINGSHTAGSVIARTDAEGVVLGDPSDPEAKAVQIQSFAEAQCEGDKHGNGHARAFGFSTFDGLLVEEGTTFVHVSSDGGSFVAISEGNVYQIRLNEISVFRSGDFASITVNALHLIETDSHGTVIENLIVGHAHADIHCNSRLHTED